MTTIVIRNGLVITAADETAADVLIDGDCLVVNGPITERRRAFLEANNVAILFVDSQGRVTPVGPRGQKLLAGSAATPEPSAF